MPKPRCARQAAQRALYLKVEGPALLVKDCRSLWWTYRAVSRYWEEDKRFQNALLTGESRGSEVQCTVPARDNIWLLLTLCEFLWLSFLPISPWKLVKRDFLMPLGCCHYGRLQLLPARLALGKAATVAAASRQRRLQPSQQSQLQTRQRRQVSVQSCSHSDTVMSQPRAGYRKNVGVCLVNQQGLVFAGR